MKQSNVLTVLGVVVLLSLPTLVLLRFWPAGVYHHDSVAIMLAVERWQLSGELTGQIFGRIGSVIVAAAGASIAAQAGLCHVVNCYSATEAGAILSGVAAAALIPLLFFLIMRKLGIADVSSYLAAILLATSPGLLLPSALGKEQSQCCLFLLLAWLLIYSLKSRIGGIIFSSLAATLAVSMHESALLYLPFLGVIWSLREKVKVFDAILWLSSAALSVFVLLGWYLVPYLNRAVTSPLPLGNVKLGLFTAFVPILLDTARLLNPAGLVLLCGGVLYGARKNSTAGTHPIFVLAASVFIIACLSPYRFRYMLFTFVALFGFLAIGLQVFSQRYRVIGYAFFFTSLILQLRVTIPGLTDRALNPAVSIRDWAKHIAELPPGKVISCDYQSFIGYYTKRETISLCTAADLQRTWKESRGTAPLLLASSALNYDPSGTLKRDLERLFEFKRLSARSHDSANGDGVTVKPYFDPIWLLLPRLNHQ